MRRDNFGARSARCDSVRVRGSKRRAAVLWEGSVEYLENGGGLSRRSADRRTSAPNSRTAIMFAVEVDINYELLMRPFRGFAGRRSFRPGDYSFNDVTATYCSASSAGSPGRSLQAGQFYDGDISPLYLHRGRVRLSSSGRSSRAFGQPCQPAGGDVHDEVLARAPITASRRDVRQRARAVRLRRQRVQQQPPLPLGVRPGSELFVVYTDERDTLQPGYPGLRNRAFVVKVNRLLRF